VTYTTQPDLLPVPDDGSQPAQALPAFRALADATQAALLRRDAITVTGGATIINGANNPATISTGLSGVLAATATNGNPMSAVTVWPYATAPPTTNATTHAAMLTNARRFTRHLASLLFRVLH
jgi:hypothetical protein